MKYGILIVRDEGARLKFCVSNFSLANRAHFATKEHA